MRDKELVKYKSKITKKFVIDILNAMCFSNTICWDGEDQFNQMPILSVEEESKGYRTEQRYALLVHNNSQLAMRLLITAVIRSNKQVCYRLKSIDEPIEIDDPPKTCVPMSAVDFDFSLADNNIGFEDDFSYSFCDNTNKTGDVSTSRVVSLLRFLLDCSFIVVDKEIFDDFSSDVNNLPPITGDFHFKPIAEITVG